jgi:hypothetical protein
MYKGYNIFIIICISLAFIWVCYLEDSIKCIFVKNNIAIDNLVNKSEFVCVKNQVIRFKSDLDTVRLKMIDNDTTDMFQDTLILYLTDFNEVFAEDYPWIVRRVKDKLAGVDLK